MIRTLYLRLVALYALLSALALGIALGIGGFLEVRALQQADLDSLSQAADTLAARITGDQVVEDRWLAQQEEQFRCLFYLEDGGVPLVHAVQNGGRELLDQDVLDQCRALPAGRREVFRFDSPDGQSWRCVALASPSANLRHPPRLILALRSSSVLKGQITAVGAKYLGLWMAAVVLLSAAGAILARIALKPTAQAIQQQNEFVAAASHELRSPLTVIRSSLQAMEVQPQRREKLQAIAASEVQRLQRLTEELLFLAGQDAHILQLHLDLVEPDTFLMEIWEAWQAPVREHGCKLTLTLPQDPVPSLSADRQRLEQLFGVLLHNAQEYAPAGSSIELILTSASRGVLFQVRDHGPGVSPRDRQQIFRRFVRGESSRTGKEHFGLGLSIAGQIAQLHGGKLWVEDTPGGGATFCLRLPHTRG